MNRKNIILIDHEPFSTTRKQLFYIDEFINSGYHVEVWDMSQVIFPGIKLANEITESYLNKLSTIEEFENLLKQTNINDTIFIVEPCNIWKNRVIFRLLSQHKCLTIKINLFANLTIKLSIWEKITKIWLSANFFRNLINKLLSILNIIYDKYYNIKFPHYYLSSSDLGNPIKKINHPDYERFRFNSHPNVINSDYIVFLDTFFPYHPDIQYNDHFNRKFITEYAQQYHKTLNHFFDFLEKKFNIPVIIAAHPKSNYSGNEFGERQIIKYKTDTLIINSSLVITQTSNAISYITLGDKPVVFISTKTSNKIPRYKYMTELLAQSLGKKTYNLDAITDFSSINFSKINENVRTAYISRYLTSKETENQKNIETIKYLFKSI